MNTEVIREEASHTVKISFKGELNVSNYIESEKTIRNEINIDTKRLIIDLTELVYISSAGLRVLVTVGKILDRQAATMIIKIKENSAILELFEISGFSQIFNIEKVNTSE